MAQRRKLAAILSADVVGYSKLMGDDEQATLSTLQAYREIFAQHIAAHDGRVVDSTGDALLAEFPSAVEAVNSAVDIQRELAGRNASVPEHRKMRFRIGVNLGDVTEHDGALYGDGVNIAARLESLAPAGGICVSGSVYDQVEGKLPTGFKFEGEQSVKNIAKPIRAYHAVLEFTENRQALRSRRTRTPILISLFVGAIALVAGVAWFTGGYRIARDASKEDITLAMPKGPAIAVLPFSNLSGDPKQDYFADGITEQLVTELARFRNLRVIARNSTSRYKGQAVDVRQVGRELGARYVLEGSIRREAETIRVTAQLLDATNGAHFWAETYERQLTAAGIFGVQDDITERVVGAIGGVYGAVSRALFEQSKPKDPASLDAYECVLRAGEYTRVLLAPQHLEARTCLERAVKLDPAYAEAWAMLGLLLIDEHFYGYNAQPDPLDRAIAAASQAMRVDPTNQRAHHVLAVAHAYKQDFDTFRAEAERAIALNPNNEEVLADLGSHMVWNAWLNRPVRERGLSLVRKAIALSPFHPGWYHFPPAWIHWWNGEYDQALVEAGKIEMADYYWTAMLYATIYGALDRRSDAAPHIANLLKLRPDITRTIRKEWRVFNIPDEVIDRAIKDLRRAGLNIPQGT